MQTAVKNLIHSSIPHKEILENKIGAPLEMVQMLLREIKDYEKYKN